MADPEQSEGLGRIVVQASYFFVGHFSPEPRGGGLIGAYFVR